MRLPLLYWPTTLVWIDDDALFLQAAQNFASKNQHIKTFNNPKDVLTLLNAYDALLPKLPLLKMTQDSDTYGLADHLPMDINMDALSNIQNHPNRANEISVIISDFHMPDMTGVEMFRAIKNCPAKKILLTGMADHKQASDAFNEGVIDCFLRKDSPNLATELRAYIQKLAAMYFTEQTAPLSHCIESDKPLHISDPIFTQYLNTWKSQNNITEHYITDRNCQLALKNDQGEQYSMVIHTDASLDAFIDLYQNDPKLNDHLKQVSARSRIPWFGENIEGWQLKPDEWHNHFYPPQVIEGREVYYISIIKHEKAPVQLH